MIAGEQVVPPPPPPPKPPPISVCPTPGPGGKPPTAPGNGTRQSPLRGRIAPPAFRGGRGCPRPGGIMGLFFGGWVFDDPYYQLGPYEPPMA